MTSRVKSPQDAHQSRPQMPAKESLVGRIPAKHRRPTTRRQYYLRDPPGTPDRLGSPYPRTLRNAFDANLRGADRPATWPLQIPPKSLVQAQSV